MRRGLLRAMAAIAVCSLIATSCANAKDEGSSSSSTTTKSDTSSGKQVAVQQPGVTADTISVGGVASVTNPLGGNYGDAFLGTKAYFDMVNSQGGIYGRQLKLTEERDDK